MNRTLSATVATLLVSGVMGWAAARSASTNQRHAAGEGLRLFRQYCQRCHTSVEMEGLVEEGGRRWFVGTARKGKGHMPAFPQLTPEDAGRIYNYFRALGAGPGEPARTGRAAGATSVQMGRRLFVSNCASCHGLDAKSGCRMVPSLVGVTEHMGDREIIRHSRGLARRMCCARHLALLRDEDFKHIVAYLRTLTPAPGAAAVRRSMPMGCCCRVTPARLGM